MRIFCIQIPMFGTMVRWSCGSELASTCSAVITEASWKIKSLKFSRAITCLYDVGSPY